MEALISGHTLTITAHYTHFIMPIENLINHKVDSITKKLRYLRGYLRATKKIMGR